MDLDKFPEYKEHQFVTYLFDKKSNLKAYICIHKSGRISPAFGATRYMSYRNSSEALADALKLSNLMSYKAALAGLSYGGGKAVIMADTRTRREDVLREYARRVTTLGGKFITGADVGISAHDVSTMKRVSPYFVGMKVDPVRFTVLGIIVSMKVVLKHLYGSDDFSGKSFAIQGVGKVGGNLAKVLIESGSDVFVTDTNDRTLKDIKRKYPRVKVVRPVEIHKQKVNIFSPCALSGTLNKGTIFKMRCDAIVGGANNQLESEEVSILLRKLNILYAPDYIVNAGGLISVVDEYENKYPSIHRITDKVNRIERTLLSVIDESEKRKETTSEVARIRAEKFFNSLK